MGKTRRVRYTPPQYLRAWRDALGLSRQSVCDKITQLLGEGEAAIDQATIAKWESGETAVRVQDIELLAKVYGVTPDRLFFDPADQSTPELFRRAVEILKAAPAEEVEDWLRLGERLARHKRPDAAD